MTASVVEVIEVKGQVALAYGAAGLIIIAVAADGQPVNPEVGDHVQIERADGWMIRRQVLDTRAFERPAGFFVAGLTRADVPAGSLARWAEEVAPLVRRGFEAGSTQHA